MSMVIEIYDCEVFKYDWLVVFKNHKTGEYTKIWNDNDKLMEHIDDGFLYVAFNSKSYDYFILKAICMGFTQKMIKSVNDYLIAGNNGWQHPDLKSYYFNLRNVDVMDDMQMGLSLKSIEGHLGLPIRESDVSFDIDRPLTQKEKQEVEEYCCYDVDTTQKVLTLRKDYFSTKIKVGRLGDVPDYKSLSMTNAKLTATILKASPKEHNDERDYVFPDNILWEYVPDEVKQFFDDIHDESIPLEEYYSRKLEFYIGDCLITVGFGGVHGAKKNYIWKESDGRVMRNKDVMGYYPHLMVYYNYTSRNIPSPEIFAEIVYTRDEAKRNHDKKTAVPYKLVTNTSYGASLNKYNPLYDPLNGRSVCITGQMFLIELACHLYKEVPQLEITQVNTDGVMYEYPEEYTELVETICNKWQERTRFTLETDNIVALYQKDVNNYIEVAEDGSIKKKGGYLVRGVSVAGAFNINNNAPIVAKAIEEYFVNGIEPYETINECEDIIEFQLIAKASGKYKSVYHKVGEDEIEVQRCNRVYATSDTQYGTLYKVKKADGSVAKIESLPEHCVIDNFNELDVSQIDKEFYIRLAESRIADFKGEKMAESKTKVVENVHTKLIKARSLFLKENVKKSGKNMKMAYTYFELKDIVPVVTTIFEKLGLISVVTFRNYEANMIIYNCDDPDQHILFTSPMKEIEPIISNTTGKEVTNAVQRLGAAQTYMRRYLYMLAMDIVEDDTIEAETGVEETVKPERKAPPSKQEREQIVKEQTAPGEAANDLQIKQLKESLKKLKIEKPDAKEDIYKIVQETDTFKNVSKKRCEEILQWVSEKLQEGKE